MPSFWQYHDSKFIKLFFFACKILMQMIWTSSFEAKILPSKKFVVTVTYNNHKALDLEHMMCVSAYPV